MYQFFIKMSKNDQTYVVYFVDLCSYINQNISNNYHNTEKSLTLFKVTGFFCLVTFF